MKVNGLYLAITLGMMTGFAQAASQSSGIMAALEGFTPHIYATRMYSDLSNYDDSVKWSVGIDYTTSKNYIFGVTYTHDAMDVDQSFLNGELQVKSNSDLLGAYVGYDFANADIRATAGLTFAMNEISASYNGAEVSDDETTVGANLGIDYLSSSKVMLSARVHTVESFDEKGVALSFGLGYNF